MHFVTVVSTLTKKQLLFIWGQEITTQVRVDLLKEIVLQEEAPIRLALICILTVLIILLFMLIQAAIVQ